MAERVQGGVPGKGTYILILRFKGYMGYRNGGWGQGWVASPTACAIIFFVAQIR